MQKALKILFSVGLALLWVCVMSACVMDSSLSSPLILASEDEPDEDRRRSSSEVGGKCDEDGDCTEICEDVYDPEGDEEKNGLVDTCVELKYKTVMQFEKIMEALEEPYDSNLRNINSSAFKSFLDVSVGPWVTEVKKASETQSKRLLAWIAKDKKISKAIVKGFENFESDYDQYEGVKEMLEALDVSDGGLNGREATCAEMCQAIVDEGVAGSSSFWNIVTSSGKTNCDGQKIVAQILFDACEGYNMWPGSGNPPNTSLNTNCQTTASRTAIMNARRSCN